MEEVIKKLSEIDMRSTKIIEATNNEKQSLELTYQKYKDDYKKQAEDLTSKQVQELREQLKVEMEAELSKQTHTSTMYLEELDHDYDNNHEKIVLDIFKSLIQI